MVGLNLLQEARDVGLSVAADGDRIVVRGPREAEALAKRILASKDEVLKVLDERASGQADDQLVGRGFPGTCPYCNGPVRNHESVNYDPESGRPHTCPALDAVRQAAPDPTPCPGMRPDFDKGALGCDPTEPSPPPSDDEAAKADGTTRLISIDDIRIGERYRKQFGNIDALAKSIESAGLLQPILVSPEKKLICGRRRIMAFKKLGRKTIPVYVVAIAKPKDAEYDENEIRENFTVSERVAIAEARREEEEAKGRGRKAEGGKKGKAAKRKSGVNSPTLSGEKDRAEARMAKSVGMDRKTLRKAREVKKAAEEEPERFGKLKEEMDRTGKVTGVHKKLTVARQVEAIEKEPDPLPTGPYRVIVVGPPWQYENRKDDVSHRSSNPYADMTIDEIKAMDIEPLAHDDAVLWLWTTNAHVREAFGIAEAWGFTYKTMLTWVKDQMGTGDWLRGKTEHCLLCVRGKPTINLTNQTTVLHAPRTKHSEKPDEFYALVEKLCPGAKVELFARKPRHGWDIWGHESE